MGIKRHDGGIVVAALLILSMTAALLKEKHIIYYIYTYILCMLERQGQPTQRCNAI